MEEVRFDPGIREKAFRYYKARLLARWAGIAYSIVFTLGFFATPLARWLSARVGTSGWQLVLYLTLVFAAYLIGDLALSYAFGYRTARRFELSTQSTKGWLFDASKSLIISLAFLVTLLLGLRQIMFQSADWWWLYAGVAWIVVTVILSNLAPVLIMPLFYKFTPLRDETLCARLQGLLDKSGTSMRGVYVMNMSSKTKAANAMVAGTANTRRIILADTLTRDYPPDEIEVVIAHELGHHHLRHLPKLLLFGSVTGLLVFRVVSLLLPVLWSLSGYHVRGVAPAAGVSDPALLPAIPFLLGLFFALLGPVQNAFSRKLEYDSDHYALRLTGNPEAFIRAMARLADQNLAVLDPPGIDEFLWYDHPPIGRRIEHARAFMRSGG